MEPSRPLRALINGAAGFVGPHLERHLALSGDDVHTVTEHTGPDLLDADGWRQLLASTRPEVVFHLAGWSDVGASWNDPLATHRVNVEGTINVLDAARRADVGRVIVVSSADVYGVVRPEGLPLTETAPVQPSSPYGASKAAAEVVAGQYWRGFGLDVVIARPFNHIGPGQSPRFVAAAFAARVATCEQEGGGVVTHGDLSPQRDLTDVRDVVRAYRLLARHGEPGQSYNICSGRAVAMSAVLDELVAQADVDIVTDLDADLLRPIDLPVLCGSHDRLTAATGWTPEIDLRASLADVLAEARQRALTPNP